MSSYWYWMFFQPLYHLYTFEMKLILVVDKECSFLKALQGLWGQFTTGKEKKKKKKNLFIDILKETAGESSHKKLE